MYKQWFCKQSIIFIIYLKHQFFLFETEDNSYLSKETYFMYYVLYTTYMYVLYFWSYNVGVYQVPY